MASLEGPIMVTHMLLRNTETFWPSAGVLAKQRLPQLHLTFRTLSSSSMAHPERLRTPWHLAALTSERKVIGVATQEEDPKVTSTYQA